MSLSYDTFHPSASGFHARPLRQAPPNYGRWCFWIGLAWLAFIVYGSLIPLEFSSRRAGHAWEQLFAFPYLDLGPQARADWVANLLLYIPAAFFLCGWLARGRGGLRVLAPLLVLAACGLVAVGIEVAQRFFPPRTVSLNDLIAEGLGTLLGIALWYLAGPRLVAMGAAIRAGGRPAIVAALVLYGLIYLALCLFPYDFVVSYAELKTKLTRTLTAPLLAPAACDFGLRCGAKLFAELLAAMPIGFLLGLLWGPGSSATLYRVFGAGVGLGLAIEIVQIFEVSGVSQGVSVLTRAGGMVLGFWLLGLRPRATIRVHLSTLRLGVGLLVVPYLILLAALNHWFDRDWLGSDQALQKLVVMPLLPFFYHYYSTETEALVSLIRVAAIYGLIGLGLWLWEGLPKRAGNGWRAALLGGGLALAMEAGKLFLDQKHPDPTNLLIAAVAAWAAYVVATWMRRWTQEPVPAAAAPEPLPATTAAEPSREPVGLVQRLLCVPLFIIVAAGLIHYPVAQVWLAAGLSAYAVALWRYPAAWLVVVPALLPILDLTPWSGRLFFNEFDLVLLLTVAVVLWRRPLAVEGPVLVPRAGLLIAVLATIQLTATVIGLLPWQPIDANAFSNYYSPYNSLRLAKGFCWALLLLALLRPEVGRGTPVGRLFTVGMLVGLAGTVLIIAWERALFSGLLDFDSDYRVTALFSGMHTGGAFVDGYLAAALPFVAACFWFWRHPALVVAGVGLFAMTLYSLLVTFSRADYLAFGLVALVLVIGGARHGRRSRRALTGSLALGAVLMMVTVAVAVPVVSGPFAQARFSQTMQSLQSRVEHWRGALAMRDEGLATGLFGMGKGSFPRTYLWQSPGGVTPGTYQYLDENGNRFLRLGAGAPLYMGQRIRLTADASYLLDLKLRAPAGDAVLSVPVCEKSLLYSFRCQWATLRVDQDSGWTSYRHTVDPGAIGTGFWFTRRPVELALHNSSRDVVVDVDEVQLIAADGRNLIANGGFEAGADRWFFASDDHLPWHVKNLWVQLLFEEGWLGLLAFAALAVSLILALRRRILAGDRLALILMASLVGFLAIGLFDSLFDEPRMVLLFYLLAWLGLLNTVETPGANAPAPRPAAGSPRSSRRARGRSGYAPPESAPYGRREP